MALDFGIIRNGESLVIHTSWFVTLLYSPLSILFLTVGLGDIAHGSAEAMDFLSTVTGIFLAVTLVWLKLSRRPLLIVGPRGVSSPLLRQAESIEWDRIADIRLGSAYTANTLDVRVWRDVDHPEAGTKLALCVAFLGLPMRTKTLIAEVLTYRPNGRGDERSS